MQARRSGQANQIGGLEPKRVQYETDQLKSRKGQSFAKTDDHHQTAI
jgi:hypothetical protein